MSANDKAAATYGPGRTTPAPIAERVVEVIIDYAKPHLDRETRWPEAEAALRALQSEAWDAGYAAGEGDRWEKKQGHRAEHDSTPNPHGSNDE